MSKEILIVDDEEGILDLLTMLFEEENYTVHQASSGQEALALLKKNTLIDVVLSDVRMPNGNGIDLMKEIKAINMKKPLVCMMTGYAEVEEEELMSMGAEKVFRKPFNMDELLMTIKDLDH